MSAWSTETWDAFCGLVEEAWPGSFDEHASDSWRVLLDPLDPEQAIGGLRRLLYEGHRFRPSASELLAAARRDPSKPTFDEAFQLIFGPRGALRARPVRGRLYATERDRSVAEDEAALERARELHPLIAAWLRVMTPRRLRLLELEDPEYGEARRAELRKSYEAFCERTDERQVAALAAGGDVRRGLRRLDPLAALGLQGGREQLPAGDRS